MTKIFTLGSHVEAGLCCMTMRAHLNVESRLITQLKCEIITISALCSYGRVVIVWAENLLAVVTRLLAPAGNPVLDVLLIKAAVGECAPEITVPPPDLIKFRFWI